MHPGFVAHMEEMARENMSRLRAWLDRMRKVESEDENREEDEGQ